MSEFRKNDKQDEDREERTAHPGRPARRFGPRSCSSSAGRLTGGTVTLGPPTAPLGWVVEGFPDP